jgi:hypothetical protein
VAESFKSPCPLAFAFALIGNGSDISGGEAGGSEEPREEPQAAAMDRVYDTWNCSGHKTKPVIG